MAMFEERPPVRSHTPELTPAARYPNLAERIIRVALHLAGILALALASVLMLVLLQGLAAIGDGLERIQAPDPVVTGCPFGEEDCGG